MTQPILILLVVLFFAGVMFQVNQRFASPVLAIINRWIRWITFALLAAYIARDFDLIARPYWQLVAIFVLVWFLGETVYNWWAIRALSVSALPLFPRYTINESGDEWPMQPRLLRVREWLRSQGFKQVQAVRAEIGGDLQLRVSVYQDALAHLRIHVIFLPQANGTITICHSLASRTPGGSRYVTDNLYVPFGGFYPDYWVVDRRPWCRSLVRLVQQHQANVLAGKELPEPWTVEPVVDLNSQQTELDRLNTELGFLHPQNDREDLGKITSQGCYRVWKEIWTLDYLGRPTRYG